MSSPIKTVTSESKKTTSEKCLGPGEKRAVHAALIRSVSVCVCLRGMPAVVLLLLPSRDTRDLHSRFRNYSRDITVQAGFMYSLWIT